MKNIIKTVLIIISTSSTLNSYSQEIIDQCFTSVKVVEDHFVSSENLVNLKSDYDGEPHADMLSWENGKWLGQSPSASLYKAPPADLQSGCRGIFIGALQWTYLGEGFALRLSSPLIEGETYTYSFTYVSHGTGSEGKFRPFCYTGKIPEVNGATSLGKLPTVGEEWERKEISFIADQEQEGDTWIIIHTGEEGRSGIFCSFCEECVNCRSMDEDTIDLCIGTEYNLNATISEGAYLWSDNSTLPELAIDHEGEYWVKLTSPVCAERIDTIVVSEVECEVLLEIPNVFTPNEDEANDTFVPIELKNIVSMRTIIYNRWGQQVFITNNLFIDWNGMTDGGQLATDGVYYWFIEYLDIFDNSKTQKGYLLLTR